MPRFFAMLFIVLFGLTPAMAATLNIEAGRDTTLIEDPAGAVGNGSGQFFFAGRTNQEENGIRRGLIFFDVAAALPPGAVIEDAALLLYQSQGNAGLNEICLKRVQDPWGEGKSATSGGFGVQAQPGDATWTDTFHPTTFWVRPGGQFIGRASACKTVDGNGYYRWEGTPHLVQDVRLWLDNPDQNNGWALLGDEITHQRAKRFASRENPDPRLRPMLEVTYRLPGEEADTDKQ